MTIPKARVIPDTPRIAEFIDVASKLISEQGYDRTSVRDIAQAMNLTSGSMFYHFKSKNDLLEAVIAKGIQDGLAYMEEALREEQGGTLRRFFALVRGHIGAVHGDLHYVHRVWIREWDKLDAEARARLRPLNEQYRQIWDTILAALNREGYLLSDPSMARHLLLPALNWTSTWARFPDETARTLLARQICAAMLNLSLNSFMEHLDGSDKT